ncbi:MAG: DUF3137 domain-containing protein [Tenuifilaceae bacterium]|jgi:hypothetical protein|nr:DUF3137 domain-containing protein [Tenuifilaceae bacterium]
MNSTLIQLLEQAAEQKKESQPKSIQSEGNNTLTPLENIRNYFNSTIKPQFEKLETIRKRISRRRKLVSFGVLVVIGIIILTVLTLGLLSGDIEAWLDENIFIVVGVTLPTLMIFGVTTLFASRSIREPLDKYREVYKEIVVRPVFKMLNTNWNYDSKGTVSIDAVRNSHIFGPIVDISCDDYMSGSIGKTDFECCDLVTYGKAYNENNEEIKRESFRGFFLHADFNKKLNGTVLVKPAPKVLLDLGSARVKMENPEFDKKFEVYTNMHNVLNAVGGGSVSDIMAAARGMSSTENHTEARYVITPRMMEAILNIEKSIGYRPVISFTKNRVNFGFFTGRELFEANIRKPISFKDIEEIHSLFTLVEVIINEMDLNTRIWTKD